MLTRLWSPPLFFRIFLIIHEVALPQTMSTTSLRAEAQPFQKRSRADTKPERWVSIHGSSSMKMSFLGSSESLMICLSASKASSQVWGSVAFLRPTKNISILSGKLRKFLDSAEYKCVFWVENA